jgi:hypothetical protein
MTSTTQLQREADSARVGLADTLDQLRDGLAPAALSAEAIALAKDGGLTLLKGLADQARANPMPVFLIGAGLAMLLTRTTGGDVARAASSTLKSAASGGLKRPARVWPVPPLQRKRLSSGRLKAPRQAPSKRRPTSAAKLEAAWPRRATP